ncbi:tyrosine-type recombinase/integrase [Gemmata sp. G18]|uniref:Tyrosine-type recombinase/integrase n=1 Tax=Gemmata palustris TaxID=2822762 RepID=A0ABS5C1M7_9BACT|nr:tyrosine-type recombinase/integrase [Gemmata palustris]MBP3959876.1 tyrosine-type recombinase/integrase [Gemmata palustris]
MPKTSKPKKPYANFPLTPHASGTWQKKIRGKIHYFGAWARRVNGKFVHVEGDGWKDALEKYKAVADDLHSGRTPRVKPGGLTVKDLANAFLTAKLRKVEAGELSSNLFYDYKLITDLLVAAFGSNRLVDDLAAEDFSKLRSTMAKRWGPVRLGNSITRAKSVFKFGYDSALLERPVRYGPEFVKPDKSVLRRHRAGRPSKMFEREDLRAMLDGKMIPGADGEALVRADPTLRAMVLLGVNCGFGNTDCAELTLTAVDMEKGWINFPRPKTGIARRCPLWPETVTAIRDSIMVRRQPASPKDANRVFLTTRGTPFVVQKKPGYRYDLIKDKFGTLLSTLGIRRDGVNFYALRHTFETIGGDSKDQVAVNLMMGHVDSSMAGVYRERIDDTRLRAVADHVRAWLWPGALTVA